MSASYIQLNVSHLVSGSFLGLACCRSHVCDNMEQFDGVHESNEKYLHSQIHRLQVRRPTNFVQSMTREMIISDMADH